MTTTSTEPLIGLCARTHSKSPTIPYNLDEPIQESVVQILGSAIARRARTVAVGAWFKTASGCMATNSGEFIERARFPTIRGETPGTRQDHGHDIPDCKWMQVLRSDRIVVEKHKIQSKTSKFHWKTRNSSNSIEKPKISQIQFENAKFNRKTKNSIEKP